MENRDRDIIILEKHVDELIQLVNNSLGGNPYDELGKIKKIVAQRNYNQFNGIEKKLKDFGIALYNRRLTGSLLINDKINDVLLDLKKFNL
jgi:hypothetical protein